MLTDKIALVTGASHETGKEIAKTLAKDGVAVIVNYDGSAAKAEEIVVEVMVAGDRMEVVQCDVSDSGKSGRLTSYVVKIYGKLDILVNNAGITRGGLFMRMSEVDFDAIINTNLEGAFNCMQHMACQMIKQKGRRTINITFVVGAMGNAERVNYAASKMGIIGTTKSTAREMASRGIAVSATAPGFTMIEVTDVSSDAVKGAMKQQILVKAFGKTSDVAETAVSPVSEGAGYITSQVVNVDGGMAM